MKIIIYSIAFLLLAAAVFAEIPRIQPANLRTDNAHDRKGTIKPEWIQACVDRKFRIMPIAKELCDPEPSLDDVAVALDEAVTGPVCKLAIVRLEDRFCYGVLLVGTSDKWLKIKYGGMIPTLTSVARVNK